MMLFLSNPAIPGTSKDEEKSAVDIGSLKNEEKTHGGIILGDTLTDQENNAEDRVLDSVKPMKRTRETKSDEDESDDNIGKPKRPKPAMYIPILRGKFLTRPRR